MLAITTRVLAFFLAFAALALADYDDGVHCFDQGLTKVNQTIDPKAFIDASVDFKSKCDDNKSIDPYTWLPGKTWGKGDTADKTQTLWIFVCNYKHYTQTCPQFEMEGFVDEVYDKCEGDGTGWYQNNAYEKNYGLMWTKYGETAEFC